MKAVLDVGQFVSATIYDQGHPGQILAAWREGRFELVTSLSILVCAVEGQVDYIVASDEKHLTPLGSYAGIPIVRPRRFLDILNR